jgi:hypothetical protein
VGQDRQQLEGVFGKIYNSRESLSATGHYKAEAGKGILSRLVAFMIGVPLHKEFRPASLSVTRKKDHDLWLRNFGGKKFSSKFYDAGEYKVEQVAFLKLFFKMTFGRSVCYECVRTSLGKPFDIISNNHPVSDHEWDFEVIIRHRKTSELIFKYWGRMKIEPGRD